MLFLKAEKPKDKALIEAISSRILSFEYEAGDSGQDFMKLEVDNGDLALFEYEGFFDADAFLIQWGSEGNMAPQHKIRIKKITGFGSLTIEGTNEMWKGDQVPVRRLWDNEETAGIVRKVAGEMGYPNPDIQVPAEQTFVTRQQYEPNARFLQRIAKEFGYAFWIDSNLHWRSRDAAQAPTTRIVYKGTSNPSVPGVVIGEPSVKFEFTRSQPGKVVGEGMKDKAKEAPASSTPQVVLWGKGSTLTSKPRITTTRFGTLQYNAEEAKARSVFSEAKELPTKQEAKVYTPGGNPQKAAGIWRGAQSVQGIDVTIVGVGNLAAGSVVEVANFGRINDGKWYVRKIKHRLDGQGFTQALTLSRSSGKKAGASGKAVKGKVNRAADVNAKGTAGTAGSSGNGARITVKPYGTLTPVSRGSKDGYSDFFSRFKKGEKK
jgi:phage protein D